MGFLKRRKAKEGAAEDNGVFVADPSECMEWAALLEFLVAERYEDGTPRVTGTLLVFADEGRLKACLCDRDQQLVGFVTGTLLLGLLRDVETVLRDDRVDWRLQRQGRPGRKRP